MASFDMCLLLPTFFHENKLVSRVLSSPASIYSRELVVFKFHYGTVL
jgi:hypothetical protein